MIQPLIPCLPLCPMASQHFVPFFWRGEPSTEMSLAVTLLSLEKATSDLTSEGIFMFFIRPIKRSSFFDTHARVLICSHISVTYADSEMRRCGALVLSGVYINN